MSVPAERARAIAAIEEHFDRLRVGRRDVQPRSFDEEEVSSYAALHQVQYPGRYLNAANQPIVVPALVFLRPAVTFGLGGGAPPMARGGIFTQTHRRYRRPLRVDEPAIFTGDIVDKYESRGYYYLVVDWRATDEAGVELASGREWHTLGFVRRGTETGPAEARSMPPPAFATEAHRSEAGIKRDDDSGRELQGRTAFGRLPAGSIGVHNDVQARRAGFGAGAVINEFHFSQLAEMLMEEFGLRWLADGEIEVKYVAPLKDGDLLRPRARLLGTADDGRVVVDIWCENQRGDRIAFGRASCGRAPSGD